MRWNARTPCYASALMSEGRRCRGQAGQRGGPGGARSPGPARQGGAEQPPQPRGARPARVACGPGGAPCGQGAASGAWAPRPPATLARAPPCRQPRRALRRVSCAPQPCRAHSPTSRTSTTDRHNGARPEGRCLPRRCPQGHPRGGPGRRPRAPGGARCRSEAAGARNWGSGGAARGHLGPARRLPTLLPPGPPPRPGRCRGRRRLGAGARGAPGRPGRRGGLSGRRGAWEGGPRP
jgi:hypothetical protein